MKANPGAAGGAGMRRRRLLVIVALYAVQYIPAIFAFMTLPIILRQEGHSATTIGLFQLAGMPYVIKFLWAPLIDRYKLARQRYKSWIVALSAVHVTALVVFAFLDPTGPLVPLFIALLIAIAAVSTQDVAVDALAISILRPDERTIGASFQTLGVYLSAIIGGFGFLYLYGQIGWTGAVLLQAALFSTGLLTLRLVEEPERPRDARAVGLRSVLRFFTQPRMGRWLALLAALRLPLILIMLPIRLMMVDQGMAAEEIALWFGLFAMSAAGAATLTLGPLMRRVPRVPALYIVGTFNLFLLVGVYILASGFPDAIRYAIVAAWAAVAVTDIVIIRGAMDKARPETPGFDFSTQAAMFTLLPILANPVAGAIIDAYGGVTLFVAAMPLALLPLGILYFGFAPARRPSENQDGGPAVSIATFETRTPERALDSSKTHFIEHGIDSVSLEANVLHLEQMGCKVEMRAVGDAIDIRIETPTNNYMTFVRDEVMEHLTELDREAAERMAWTGDVRAGKRPANFLVLRTVRRREVFPGLIRVTLSGSDVAPLAKEGIHIKLMMPADRGRRPVWPKIAANGRIEWPQGRDTLHTRFVTIRNIREQEGEIDIDVAHHDGGLISDWAALDGDAQDVGVMGPGGDVGLPHCDNVVLAADYAGLPAIARLIENAHGNVSGRVFAAAPSQAALEDYLPSSGLDVTALDPATFAGTIGDRIRNCGASDVSYAWFAGEFASAQAVRSIFKNGFGLGKGDQLSMAYWRRGAPGHSSVATEDIAAAAETPGSGAPPNPA